MSVNTKMFVATSKENILKIMPKVIEELNKWQREKLDNYWKENGFKSRVHYIFNKNKSNNPDFTNGVNTSTYDFLSFKITFTVNGEKRILFITHTCSNDYQDIYEGEKIIFSLGCWGMSEEIMLFLSEVVKEFGDVYFTKNNSTDDFEKI